MVMVIKGTVISKTQVTIHLLDDCVVTPALPVLIDIKSTPLRFSSFLALASKIE